MKFWNGTARHHLRATYCRNQRIWGPAARLLWAVFVVFALATEVCAGEQDTPLPLERIFHGAERLGPFEGSPRAAAVWRQGRLAGYLLLTTDVVRSVGYSGKAIKTAVGIDLTGKITGAVVIEQDRKSVV